MKFVQVKNVKKQNYQGKIYDLEVMKTHTYNIENVVVGNCSSGLHGVGKCAVLRAQILRPGSKLHSSST